MIRRGAGFLALAAAAVMVTLLTAAVPRGQKVRVLYWNIQNGMWADQADNYANFIHFVKEKNPDICVWCEAKSLYVTGTDERLTDEERYLLDGWPELASRYGHDYTFVAMHRDNYPQVITSKRPITGMAHIEGAVPDSIVAHGAGWVKVGFGKDTLNVVCIHTYPQKYAYGIPKEDRERSSEANEGDRYRAMEVKYVCEHTILSHGNGDDYWVMLGDFNSKSRLDNFHYQLPEDWTGFQCHDYINGNTPYIDVIARLYPGEFCTSNRGTGRIDYAYCSPALFEHLKDARIVNEDWTIPVKSEKCPKFFEPSDHRPIVLDFVL